MTETTLDALAPYNELRATIEGLKAQNADITFDYTKPQGIKAAKSHIYTLRQHKAAIEKVRKVAKAESLEYGRKVDSVAKELTAEVEGMIDVHDAPIRAIEEREAARKAKHEEALAKLNMPELPPTDSAALQSLMEGIGITPIDESWEEYEAPARKLRDQTLQQLADLKAAAVKREAEAAELERLRKEAVERERAEREARIAKEAAEAATREAEAKAAAAAKKAQDEADANLRAEKEKAARAAEEAARVKREAEAKAKREAEAAAKRAADEAHRGKVIGEAAAALAAIACSPDDGAQARIGTALAEAIAEGKIPHVTMRF